MSFDGVSRLDPGLTLFGEPVEQTVDDHQAVIRYRCAGCEVEVRRSDLACERDVDTFLHFLMLDLKRKVSKARRSKKALKPKPKPRMRLIRM